MDGKRYAAGLLAGLLVGFLVVVAGSQGAVHGNFVAGLDLPSAQATTQSQSSTAVFVATITVLTTSAANALKGPNASSSSTTMANQGNPQQAQTTTTQTTISISSTTSPSPTSGVVFAAAITNPVPSSSLYNIVHQPAFSDIIVLVPLLLAFILGAVIYRLSGTKDKD